jgi:hypothetical protein
LSSAIKRNALHDLMWFTQANKLPAVRDGK